MSEKTRKSLRLGLFTAAGLTAIASAVFLSSHSPTVRTDGFASAEKSTPEVGVPAARDGKLLKWLVSDGDHVTKGQLIAQLDVTETEARIRDLEAQISQLEQKGSSAIQPMTAITGTLPDSAPATIKIPVKVPVAQRAVSQPPSAPSLPSQKTVDMAKAEVEKLKRSVAAQQLALDRANTEITALADKISAAQASFKAASEKASNAKALFDQGVISEKRAAELGADEDSASRALSSLLVELESDKRAATAAQKAKETAEAQLPEAEKVLASAQTKLVAEKAAQPAVAKSLPELQDKIVYRTVPTAKLAEETVPVKLFVDENTMDSVESKRKALENELQQLKLELGNAKIYASETGEVHLHRALAEHVSRGAVIATIER